MFSAAFSPRIALMAYWTCQFAFSWVCESPPCCERSYHYEQLTASRAVHSLNTSARVFFFFFFFLRGSIFPWTETFHPEEGFLVFLDGGSGRRKQMLVLERRQHVQETRGPGWCAWTETEKCLLFRCEFQMGGRAIKSARPELSLGVKARRLSDEHICSAARFFGNVLML